MRRINRNDDADVLDAAEAEGKAVQLVFEVGGLFSSVELAQAYADKLMDAPEFAAFCGLLDADLFCFIRNFSTGDSTKRNVNGSEDWEDLPR